MGCKDRSTISVLEASTTVGFLAGSAFLLPFIGRISGIPSIATAVPVAVAALIVAVVRADWKIAIRRDYLSALVCISLFCVLVLQASAPSQIAFLFNPGGWLARMDNYIDAKVLTFFVTAAPAVIAAAALALARDPRAAGYGVLAACIIVGLIAIVRLAPFADYFVRSEGLKFYYLKYALAERDLNTVSLGLLIAVGGIASLAFRKLWPVTVLFLVALFLLNRRMEFTFLLACVSAIALASAWKWRADRNARPIGIIASAVVLIAIGYNDANVQVWSSLPNALGTRIGLVSGTPDQDEILRTQSREQTIPTIARTDNTLISDTTLKAFLEDSSVPTNQPSDILTPERGPILITLFGAGVGHYATLEMGHNYPHNILVEAFIETGIISALALGALIVITGFASWRFWRSQEPLSLVCLPVLYAFIFLFTMKSGDLAMTGRLIGLSLILLSLASIRRTGTETHSGP